MTLSAKDQRHMGTQNPDLYLQFVLSWQPAINAHSATKRALPFVYTAMLIAPHGYDLIRDALPNRPAKVK